MTLYKATEQVSSKIDTTPNDKGNITDNSKYIKRTVIAMAKLFDVEITSKNAKKYNIPEDLVNLVEIEVIYRKKGNIQKIKILKTLIDDVTDNQWDKISADDLRSFFLPIFSSDYIKKNEKYFQDLEIKLTFCLDYYSIIDSKHIPTYLSDDIMTFINCIYHQKELPIRDYKKILEIFKNGEI